MLRPVSIPETSSVLNVVLWHFLLCLMLFFLKIIKNIVYSDDISMIFLSGLNILLFGINYFWMWIINVPYICLLVRLTLSEEGRCNLSFQLVNVCLLSAQNVCIHLWHCTVSQMNKDNTKLHWKRKLKNSYFTQTLLQTV